ncbi:hypothetical protein B0H13DRAFT_1880546 [Mycena leptocephala]|nr:hypothetical protein B0H13DRAFT_1880546 [Mycena leptocephala]
MPKFFHVLKAQVGITIVGNPGIFGLKCPEIKNRGSKGVSDLRISFTAASDLPAESGNYENTDDSLEKLPAAQRGTSIRLQHWFSRFRIRSFSIVQVLRRLSDQISGGRTLLNGLWKISDLRLSFLPKSLRVEPIISVAQNLWPDAT